MLFCSQQTLELAQRIREEHPAPRPALSAKTSGCDTKSCATRQRQREPVNTGGWRETADVEEEREKERVSMFGLWELRQQVAKTKTGP
eukprot:scaffold803_cov310-Pinguiococcus_pyrenoidosus.AAC.90